MRTVVLLIAAVSAGLVAQQSPAPNPPVGVPPEVAPASHPPVAVTNEVRPMAQQLYSHGDPTPEEQLMLEYINRARANPAVEGERLASTTDPDVVQAYQYFGIDRNKVRADFRNYPARPPLAFHPKLIQAARNHSLDMQRNDFQGHEGSDGSTLIQRLQRAGYSGGTAFGENVFAYAKSMWHAHCGFNVDWGGDNQQTLGHRRNIMNFDGAVYTEIGIGVVRDDNPATQVGPYIVTEDFAQSQTAYIVGVVYRDRNGNGFYDIGEGIAGVTITPSRGEYYTVTSTSGGYAIPVTGLTGTITLTAQGNGFVASKTVTLTGTNVKVDFTQEVAPVPLPLSPDDGLRVRDTVVQLVWRSIPQAQRYWLQVARDSSFRTLIVNDSTRRDTMYQLRGLQNRQQYYWRVRGRHATLGWSDFSAASHFTVVLPLQVPTLYEPGDTVLVDRDSLVFRWSSAGDTVDRYWLEIVTDTSTYDLVFDHDVGQDTSYVMVHPRDYLEAGQTYYWHVMVFGLDETVPTPWKHFVATTSTSVEESSSTSWEVTCRYDAVADALTLYAPPGSAALLYDGLGALRARIASIDVPCIVLPVHGLPAGMYYLVVRNGSQVRRVMIPIVR